MLYALRHPLSLLILVVAFVVGLLARAFAQRLFAGARRRPAWARDLPRSGGTTSLRWQLDPYGTVGAILGGVGWGRPAEVITGRITTRQVLGLLSGPVVQAALGIGCLIGLKAVRSGGDSILYRPDATGLLRGSQPFRIGPGLKDLVHGGSTLPVVQLALLLGGVELLAMGILAILPIPPLDGGRLLFALAPKSGGWARAGYKLQEDNWGIGIVVLLTIIPLVAAGPILVVIVGAIAEPIMRAVGL
jgi:Zn-dependent protease